MISSKTTQNSIAGSGITATIILTIINAVRSKWPEYIWPEKQDTEIITYLTVVLGPLLARQIAFLRNPEKKQ